jgi:hypothetical protein
VYRWQIEWHRDWRTVASDNPDVPVGTITHEHTIVLVRRQYRCKASANQALPLLKGRMTDRCQKHVPSFATWTLVRMPILGKGWDRTRCRVVVTYDGKRWEDADEEHQIPTHGITFHGVAVEQSPA